MDHLIPATEDALDQVEAQFAEVAAAEGGEYDGYERDIQQYPLTPSSHIAGSIIRALGPSRTLLQQTNQVT